MFFYAAILYIDGSTHSSIQVTLKSSQFPVKIEKASGLIWNIVVSHLLIITLGTITVYTQAETCCTYVSIFCHNFDFGSILVISILSSSNVGHPLCHVLNIFSV